MGLVATMLYCTVCGSWAHKRVCKLAEVCCGVAQKGSYGAYALKRIQEGLHPLPRKTCTMSHLGAVEHTTPRGTHNARALRPDVGSRLEQVLSRIRAKL